MKGSLSLETRLRRHDPDSSGGTFTRWENVRSPGDLLFLDCELGSLGRDVASQYAVRVRG